MRRFSCGQGDLRSVEPSPWRQYVVAESTAALERRQRVLADSTEARVRRQDVFADSTEARVRRQRVLAGRGEAWAQHARDRGVGALRSSRM